MRAIRKLARRIIRIFRYYSPREVRVRSAQQGNLELFRQYFGADSVLTNIVDRASSGTHRLSAENAQFVFVSNELFELRPSGILDIGSHLSWLYGVGSYYQIETLDVRDKETILNAERFHRCPVEQLPFPDESRECITSICSLEHFGLGAYGDPIAVDGDLIALRQIARVLKSGGHFIFTTTMNRRFTYVEFNVRRIYSYERLHELAAQFGFRVVAESFYSMSGGKYVDLDEVTTHKAVNNFDLYLGHWIKSSPTSDVSIRKD